ncbi:MAG: hypothetical protein WCR68_03135 [Candidatus Dojkabacteria bacterium]|jgi:heme/copper-type cytochrome/quinol oxidase subunit 4
MDSFPEKGCGCFIVFAVVVIIFFLLLTENSDEIWAALGMAMVIIIFAVAALTN